MRQYADHGGGRSSVGPRDLFSGEECGNYFKAAAIEPAKANTLGGIRPRRWAGSGLVPFKEGHLKYLFMHDRAMAKEIAFAETFAVI